MSAAEDAPVSLSEARSLFADLTDASSLVLAISGGPDSTALLLLAALPLARLFAIDSPGVVAMTGVAAGVGILLATARGVTQGHRQFGRLGAALAVLDTFAARDANGLDVLARNRQAATHFTELTAPLRAHPRVRSWRQQGMIWAWDIATDEPTFAARYHRAALAAGLLLRPIGSTLYVMPPYVLTPDDQQFLADGLVRVLDQVLGEIDALPHSSAPVVPVP